MKYIRQFSLIAIDLFLIQLSYILAIWLVNTDVMILDEIPHYYFIILGIFYVALFGIFKLYESLWNYASIDEFLWAIAANLVAGISIYFLFNELSVFQDFRVNIVAVIFSIVSTTGIRLSFRIFRRGVKSIPYVSKSQYERLMIVGAGEAGNMIIREIRTNESVKFKPIVFIDDDNFKLGKSVFGIKVEGNRNDIERIVKEKNIDTIIIAMPSVDNENKYDIINTCKKTNCKLKIVPGLYQIINEPKLISKVRDVELEDLLGRDTVMLDNKGIEQYIKDRVVLVTGGGGSIGSELCRQIARFQPKTLIIFDIYENNAYDIQNELKSNFKDLKFTVLIGSVRDYKRLENIFCKYRPDIVFHAAAHKHVPLMEDSPNEAVKNNVFGTLNLAELSDKYKVKRFVLISTDKAVNPTNVMGATKRLCEMIVQATNEKSLTEFVAVRFGNVLGSNGSVIPLFRKQIRDGGPVTVTHKDITRFFMLIPEAAQLVLQAGAYTNGGAIFVLDMGKPIKIYELAEDIIRLSGYEPHEDIQIKVTGLRPGEKLYEELLMQEEGLKKTTHEKIFVGASTFKQLDLLKKELEQLRVILDTENDYAIIKKLKEIVPTFKSPEEINKVIQSEQKMNII